MTAFADVTGDGLADAIAVRDDGIWVMPSNGSGFAPRDSRWTFSFFISDLLGTYGTYFADVTGDGKADVILLNATNNLVMVSNGSSFGPASTWSERDGLGSIAQLGSFFADVTGDGKADAVLVGFNGIDVSVSTGTSFVPTASWLDHAFFGERGTFFADVTGDGRADAIAVSETVSTLESSGSSFAADAITFSSEPFYATRDVPACVDGVQAGDETDVDCGGSCVPCAIGKQCRVPTDCADGTCVSGTCVPSATCADGVKNGRETDVDCGGFCQACPDHLRCMHATDCESEQCGIDVSASPLRIACVPGTCTDGIRDTGESGADCGGSSSCARCPNGQPCETAGDCASGFCKSNVCTIAPGCNNGVQDTKETDVDCGGPDATCARCADHSRCVHASDCASGVCGVDSTPTGLRIACRPATCSDGVKNQGESDVDCGGATGCPRCPASKTCTTQADCQTGSCALGLCQTTTCSDGVRDGKETDVDCGGWDGVCPRCADHLHCVHATDCQSGSCGIDTFSGIPRIACRSAMP
jgi:hypothetical protein